MHEWALAEAIITAAYEVADKQKLRAITEVDVRIGELQQIDREVLKFAFSQLKQDRLKDATFHVQTAKSLLKCRSCGNEWVFRKKLLDKKTSEKVHFVPELAHVYVKCPKCGSPDFEIVSGRGVWLANVRGVQ